MTTWDVRKASLDTVEGLQHQLLQASVEGCKGLREPRGSSAAGDHGCPVGSRLVSSLWKPMRFLVLAGLRCLQEYIGLIWMEKERHLCGGNTLCSR